MDISEKLEEMLENLTDKYELSIYDDINKFSEKLRQLYAEEKYNKPWSTICTQGSPDLLYELLMDKKNTEFIKTNVKTLIRGLQEIINDERHRLNANYID